MTDDAAIRGFADDWAFLSNLYPSPVEWRDMLFPSVENAFQAAKTDDRTAWQTLTTLSPADSASFGRMVALRPQWDDEKLAVMAGLLALKYEIPALRRRLVATGSRPLLNVNWWGDRFWGQVGHDGANHLGRLLMDLRQRIAVT